MPSPARATAADHAVCARLIEHGSRSFFAASLLLPAPTRRAAYAIYGFCRLSDDAVDEARGGLVAVARLRARLAKAARGAPEDHPVDRALSATMAEHAIPEALLGAVLEGMEWDAEGRTYADEASLLAYCARVAGAVGAIMCCLMGARDPYRLARACDLGVAMQLTNIARDLGEDARAGRLYLPLAWLEEAGISPQALPTLGAADERLRGLTARLLARAEALYRRAEPGIAALDPRVRGAIWAARLVYAEIGAQIARDGHDSLSQRAVVSTGRKAALVAQALVRARLPGPRPVEAAVLPACAFLVEAARASSERVRARGFDADVAWLMDLFADLSRREASAQSIRWMGGRR